MGTPRGVTWGAQKSQKIFFPILSFFGPITYIEMFYDRFAQKMTIFGRFSSIFDISFYNCI